MNFRVREKVLPKPSNLPPKSIESCHKIDACAPQKLIARTVQHECGNRAQKHPKRSPGSDLKSGNFPPPGHLGDPWPHMGLHRASQRVRKGFVGDRNHPKHIPASREEVFQNVSQNNLWRRPRLVNALHDPPGSVPCAPHRVQNCTPRCVGLLCYVLGPFCIFQMPH